MVWELSLFLFFFPSLLCHSVQFSSVAQSCPTLCDRMNCSTPGLPIYHQLLEFTQIHVHWVSDAIQPFHPLSSPSPPAPNPSQHQSLFQWLVYHYFLLEFAVIFSVHNWNCAVWQKQFFFIISFLRATKTFQKQSRSCWEPGGNLENIL